MFNSNAFKKFSEDQSQRSGEVAKKATAEMSLPKFIELPLTKIKLGKKIAALAKMIRSDLDAKHSDNLPKVMAIALHEYWFACCEQAAITAADLVEGKLKNNSKMRLMATPSGFADTTGWSCTLANHFGSIDPNHALIDFIKETVNAEILEHETVFKCMALYWIYQANTHYENGQYELAFDVLHEVHQALAFQVLIHIWDSALKDANDKAESISASKVRSDLARKAANASHIETRNTKLEIEKFWQENISSAISNDAAAEILTRQFPLRFRTLSGYVAEFKKTPR